MVVVHRQIKRQNSGLPSMESVNRIKGIPIVETGLKTAEHVYKYVKTRNSLFTWGLETAEGTVFSVIDSIRPVVRIIEGPLQKLDSMMCKSLDMVEQRVPSVYLPPQLMYWNTKEYMSDHIVQPVIKRADSVKNLGADIVDGAINVADKYVEKYLPEPTDETDGSNVAGTCGSEEEGDDDENASRAVQAIHHGKRFSRKLKHRLSVRTSCEVKALKKQSAEAVHILIYSAELIATNPRLAVQKAAELWDFLSIDEPENQARPQTLEQLLVMVTRETARRLVHLVNFTFRSIGRIPSHIQSSIRELVHYGLYFTDSIIKAAHLEKAKTKTVQEAEVLVTKMHSTYDELQNYATSALLKELSTSQHLNLTHMSQIWVLTIVERLAVFLSGRLEAEKISTTPRRRLQARSNNPDQSNINGVY